MPLAEALTWIEGSTPARVIATVPHVYPFISALHLVGIGLLFGAIVPVDLRLLRLTGPQFDRALPSLVRIAVFGFALAAASGVSLACVRIGDYADNPAFLAKMGILLAAGTNALVLRRLTPSRDVVDAVGTAMGRIAAAASLLLWLAAVFAGRWIAFT